jgi:subtilisin family serine protease
MSHPFDMPRPRFAPIAVATLFACAAALLPATTRAQTTPSAAPNTANTNGKTPITRADQLPRRTYTLAKLPSELLEGPMADLAPLIEALQRDTLSDLATYDIQDAAALRSLHGLLLSLAMMRGDTAEVKARGAAIRALQDKPGLKLTSALANEAVAEARAAGGDTAAQAARLQAQLTERLAALPWSEVENEIKGTKSAFEVMNPSLTVTAFRNQLDPVARNANLAVPAGVAASVLATRAQRDHVVPMRGALLAAYSAVVDRNANAAARPDRWTERTQALAANAKASPVVVAVWDSGVDMALFKTLPDPANRGLAFDADWHAVPDLLRPLGNAASRWPRIKSHVKGSFDLQTALDTEDSRKLKQAIAALKPEELQGFQEDLAIGTLYTHGTHVAGIAVEGNPFASVYAVSMHFSHKSEPVAPTEERSRRTAAAYQRAVDSMKAAGVRVVNMSWRYSPAAYEGALSYHNLGKDAQDRKQMAARLFAIERDALRAAFASAPNILFVAGSGNENNSADFQEYIPAGLELPNLITVGAVDVSGVETAFSTFGKTVVVHANGFEVDSLLPGGDRARYSGASMAAPQVTNLAAKLIALDPSLSATRVKQLILDHAQKNGRVNLVHPKATLAALGAKSGG